MALRPVGVTRQAIPAGAMLPAEHSTYSKCSKRETISTCDRTGKERVYFFGMVVSFLGGEAIKVSFGETTLAFNPISKDSRLKSNKFGADITFVSINHPDMNGMDQTKHGEKEPFVISGPGEYEIRGIAVRGFDSSSHYGGEEKRNTIFYAELENMHLLYLGALGEKNLPTQVLEAIDDVDVLFVPIGGDGVLSPSDAQELAVKLEAKVVVPIHYESGQGAIGNKDALKTFLKEGGQEGVKSAEKLTLKPKDLIGKSGEIIVLSA